MTGSRADELRELASFIRGGLPLRPALVRWGSESDEDDIQRIGRRAALGAPLVGTLSGTAFEPIVANGFELHLSSGIDLARWLDDVAARIELDLGAVHSARAASAGALLSGRMVAGLPLLFVPMVPLSRGAITDVAGVGLLFAGIVLACTGLWWIGRLVPRPPGPDVVTELCASTAALLDAGLDLPAALGSATLGLDISGGDPVRLVRLGWSWQEALAQTDPSFEPLCAAITRGRDHGLALSATLRSLDRRRRERAQREFDRRLKRAPVLMVVPLTCCVLPAYGLLGLAPFLRSMSVG